MYYCGEHPDVASLNEEILRMGRLRRMGNPSANEQIICSFAQLMNVDTSVGVLLLYVCAWRDYSSRMYVGTDGPLSHVCTE